MLYRERLWPAPWMFVAVALVIPAALVVFLPINPGIGIVAAVILYGGIITTLLVTSPALEVDEREFRAGRAHLPLEVVAGARVFHGADAVLERGQRLDARAWTLFRGWVSPVLRVDLDDPDDPAPYWLVSSRRPEALAAALTTARAD